MQRWYAGYKSADKELDKFVKIIGCNVKKYAEYNIIGDIGKIENYRSSTGAPCEVKAFAIRISGKVNPGSEKGLFWVSPECLELFDKKEYKTMNKNVYGKDAKFAILTNPAKSNEPGTVGVYYGELKAGDLVVCNYGYGNGALSVRVVEISDREPECVGVVDCEIMGACDITEYLDHKTKRERRAELKKQMIAQAKRFQEEEYWRLLSESDPAMKTLYEEFKELED